MFIKLLAIKIVANSFFGLSSRLIMICSCLDTFPSFTSKSDGLRENRATSEPEISAEDISRIKKRIILNTSENSNTEKKM